LVKPDGTDLVDIAVINSNYDKIDANIASTKIQATKPSTANAGDLWWDSNTGTLYLYYVDANSAQWVAATSDPVNIGVVANQTERDAQYPTPGQGMRVYRTDLGVTQTYYGLYNVSTNPGGRDVAGWYDTEKNVGLVPIQSSVVTFVGGTGSANSLGQLNFSGITSVRLDNVFSARYTNYYFVINLMNNGVNSDLTFRVSSGGTPVTSSDYQHVNNYSTPFQSFTSVSTQMLIGEFGSTIGEATSGNLTVFAPFTTTRTNIVSQFGGGSSATPRNIHTTGRTLSQSSYDGIQFLTTSGNMTGNIQCFGYNK
jgi:hypothetical protein